MLTILFVYKQRSDPAPTKERWLRLRNTGQGAWGPEPNSKLKIVPSAEGTILSFSAGAPAEKSIPVATL